MIRKKKKINVRKLLEEAYKLGFEVGYYGHYEYVGWVREKRERIESIAQKIGVLDKVEAVYRRGKEDGENKRSRDLAMDREIAVERNKAHKGVRALRRHDWKPKFIAFPKFLMRRR